MPRNFYVLLQSVLSGHFLNSLSPLPHPTLSLPPQYVSSAFPLPCSSNHASRASGPLPSVADPASLRHAEDSASSSAAPLHHPEPPSTHGHAPATTAGNTHTHTPTHPLSLWGTHGREGLAWHRTAWHRMAQLPRDSRELQASPSSSARAVETHGGHHPHDQ